MEHIHHELVIESSFADFLCCLDKSSCDLSIQKPQIAVDRSSMLLDLGESANQSRWKGPTAYGKIVPGPLGLGPIVGTFRDPHLSHAVGFDSKRHGPFRGKKGCIGFIHSFLLQKI